MKMNELVTKFQLWFPELVKAMKDSDHHYSPQDISGVHIEGDVWTHSQMVNLIAEQRNSNFLVKLACLLHDTGKPMSRSVQDENKRARFFNHEGMSVFMGLNFLNRLDLTPEQKVRVCQLISLHTVIHKAMRAENFESEISQKFSGNVSLLEDLIEISACDVLGRFMDEEDRPFWNDSATNLEHILYKTNSNIYPRETSGEAIILVGTPLSGKTSWVKNNAKDHLVLSRDQVILDLGKNKTYDDAFKTVKDENIDREYDKRRKEALASKQNLIFDLTHMTEKSRRRSMNGIAKDMKRKAVVFLVSYNTLMARNKYRSKNEQKSMSYHAMKTMMGNFMMPLISEGFDEIEYIFEKDQK